eukprot:1488600-Rhodomonas_salina.1
MNPTPLIVHRSTPCEPHGICSGGRTLAPAHNSTTCKRKAPARPLRVQGPCRYGFGVCAVWG